MTADADVANAPPADAGLLAIFAAERAALLRFMRARCTNPADADDLLQELWVKIGSAARGPVSNPRAYLFRMANNLVLDTRRAQQRAMTRDRGWLAAQDHGDAALELRPDPAPDAEAMLARRQELDLLETAIGMLPPGAARALRLHRIEGLPQGEVAQIMGISRSGVEKHLATALRHLRNRLYPMVNPDCGYASSAASDNAAHDGPVVLGRDHDQ